jgi:hypothetical protein
MTLFTSFFIALIGSMLLVPILIRGRDSFIDGSPDAQQSA